MARIQIDESSFIEWIQDEGMRQSFQEVPFSRTIVEQLPSYKCYADEYKSVSYYTDYSALSLIVEYIADDMYNAYLRDNFFGYIKNFGSANFCWYPTPEDDILDDLYESSPLAHIAADLYSRIESGEIDLDRELYDYYHVLPNEQALKRVVDFPTMTVREAASSLGLTAARVKKLIADRMLDSYRCEGVVYIPKESVALRLAFTKEHGRPTKGNVCRGGFAR